MRARLIRKELNRKVLKDGRSSSPFSSSAVLFFPTLVIWVASESCNAKELASGSASRSALRERNGVVEPWPSLPRQDQSLPNAQSEPGPLRRQPRRLLTRPLLLRLLPWLRSRDIQGAASGRAL